MIYEKQNQFKMRPTTRDERRSVACRVQRVQWYISTLIEQKLHYRSVAVATSLVEGRIAVSIDGIRVGVMFQQLLYRFYVPLLACNPKLMVRAQFTAGSVTEAKPRKSPPGVPQLGIQLLLTITTTHGNLSDNSNGDVANRSLGSQWCALSGKTSIQVDCGRKI